MQDKDPFKDFISLDVKESIWEHFYTVAPLVVIGTKENQGFDLAPKHMATPLGFSDFFGFVCTPRHNTYHNIKKNQRFSVSFVKPEISTNIVYALNEPLSLLFLYCSEM